MSSYSSEVVVQNLLKNGANVNEEWSDGSTALHEGEKF
jgi:ankyrin repeat protein